MVGTTPVTLIEHTLTPTRDSICPLLLTSLCFISLAPSVGKKFSDSYLKTWFPLTLYFKMESNLDSTALAQQVQALAATIEELTKQNQEMKLRLQQVQQAQQNESRSKGNLEGEGDSHGRGTPQRPTTSDEQNSDLLREMRKEMDELRSAIKEKTNQSVDKMVRATDSPFTAAVLECPVPSKFCLPQLEPFDGLKDP